MQVDAVDIVDPADVTDIEALRSGFASAALLLEDLRGTPDLTLFRVEFHLVDGPDPRTVLANDADPDDYAVADISRRLDRMDRASRHGPWTGAVLDLIAAHPERRAPDLAAILEQDTQPFKRDVRKLKNLGLTISLRRGYRLSPRGEAHMARVGRPS